MDNTLSLNFIAGPLAGQIFRLEKLETSLGNRNDCDIQLTSEMFTEKYISFYVGSESVSIIVDSSGYKAILNDKLIDIPLKVSAGDVLFFPDGSILYFDNNSDNIIIQIDFERNSLIISDSNTQRVQFVPIFSAEYLCNKGFEALKAKDYLLANTYFQEAKKYNSNYSQIYRGLLFIELRISSEEQIEDWDENLSSNQNFQKFLELGHPAEKAPLYNRVQSIIWSKKKTKYDKACEIMAIAKEPEDLQKTAELFEDISDFFNSQVLADRCRNESLIREEQKKQWLSYIEQEEKRQKNKSGFASLFLIISIFLLILSLFLFIKKDRKIKDSAFIESILSNDISNQEAIIQDLNEKYTKSPDKYFDLLQKAFTQAYTDGNNSHMNNVIEICLNSDPISKRFSEYLAYEYRDFAVDYLTNQLQNYVDNNTNGLKSTDESEKILDSYVLISEVSLKIMMELLDKGELDQALFLMDFLDDNYDMSPIINSTIRPMFIEKTINTKTGYYDNTKNKFKDSSKKNSIGWTESTTTYYHGDLACRKTRVYDPDIHWEGDPSYEWYYKGEYISSTSCSNLDYILKKYTTYTFGSYNVEIERDSYVFKNSDNGKTITLKIKN